MPSISDVIYQGEKVLQENDFSSDATEEFFKNFFTTFSSDATDFENWSPDKWNTNKKFILVTKKVLQKSVDQHRGQISRKNSQTIRKDSFLSTIAKCDRYIASLEAWQRKTCDGVLPTDVSSLFQTEIAKDQLRKWTTERTSVGRKRDIDERILQEKSAQECFIFRPLDYDFLTSSFWYRYVSAYGLTFKENPDLLGDLMVLKEGEYVPLSTISSTEREQIKTSLKDTDHLLGTQSHFFHYEKGICHTDDSCTPFLLKRKNNRKNSDYRVEIVTTQQNDDMPHASIRMKNPEGECYSFAKYILSADNNSCCFCQERAQRCGPSVYEFMGLEKETKTTKIRLTKSEYDAILESLEKEKVPATHQMLSNNCTTWIKRVCVAANIEVNSSSGSALFIKFTGLGKKWRKWSKNCCCLRVIEKVVNFVERFFTAFFSFFVGNSIKSSWDWMIHSGKIENPWILRECWQEEVEEWREEEKQKILAEQKNCTDPLLLKTLDERLQNLPYILPE